MGTAHLTQLNKVRLVQVGSTYAPELSTALVVTLSGNRYVVGCAIFEYTGKNDTVFTDSVALVDLSVPDTFTFTRPTIVPSRVRLNVTLARMVWASAWAEIKKSIIPFSMCELLVSAAC